MRDLRRKIAVAKAAGVEKQRIEEAELKLKQHESLVFVVDVAVGSHAIEKEAIDNIKICVPERAAHGCHTASNWAARVGACARPGTHHPPRGSVCAC